MFAADTRLSNVTLSSGIKMLGHKEDQRSTVNKYYQYWPLHWLVKIHISSFEEQNFRVEFASMSDKQLYRLSFLHWNASASCRNQVAVFRHNLSWRPVTITITNYFSTLSILFKNNLQFLLWTLLVCDMRNSLHSWGCFKRLSKIWIHSWPGSHNWSPLKLILVGLSEGIRI